MKIHNHNCQTSGTLSRRHKGFTFIELIVVIALVAILASVAVPGFRTLVLNNAQTATVNNVVSAFTAARGEAIKRGQPVVACPSSDSATGCGSNWADGVVVFADPDGDGAPADEADIVLYTGPLAKQSNVSANRSKFEFRSFNQRSDNGTVFVCDTRGVDHAKAVIVNVSGRPHVAQPGAGNVSWSCP